MSDINDQEIMRRQRLIAYWLFVVIAMVFLMVILGGVTRLTHSGLSMVEWRPLTGWLPPFNDPEWMVVFERYQQSPEFMQINSGMDLEGFKSIFWLEFLHRLWGRIIGVAFALPFLFFLARGWVARGLSPKLGFMFVLGGLQGVMGWYMVKSGLVDRPDVSQYRLTAHFGLALVIIGYIEWVALGLLFSSRDDHSNNGLGLFATVLAAWAFITALSGGFVAGIDAGFAFNTFPLMDGDLIPPGLYETALSPFEDITTVQFNHRLLAEALIVLTTIFWFKARNVTLSARSHRAVNVFAGVVAVQATLGITTLLLVIPVPLAAAHQAGAVAVFMAALWTAHETTTAA
ncbi:MAG: heme A synthase [Rhodospirillaceae bacterium]|jgi:heme a synthase|nr:heme A synthase [Rhodospirillaceae bacterium]MBT4219440.1 heme A synthase [Rhodospirillaceae bacterium]MBT4463789.1 heme A synthase [Rhodospirillaceae bacterium]MBT7355832.1 heme A synthase [Rhodospirillaceae bacterium]